MATTEEEIIKIKQTQGELIVSARILKQQTQEIADILGEIIILPRKVNIERIQQILTSMREVKKR